MTIKRTTFLWTLVGFGWLALLGVEWSSRGPEGLKEVLIATVVYCLLFKAAELFVLRGDRVCYRVEYKDRVLRISRGTLEPQEAAQGPAEGTPDE